MIAIAAIFALTTLFIIGLAVFWKDIVEWIKKVVNKIQEMLGIVVQGTRTFIIRTREGLKNRVKFYNQNKLTGEWEETVHTKNVDESKVPADILAKVRKQSVDVEVPTTEELRLVINA